MSLKPETVLIAITCLDGSLTMMRFVTKQQRALFKNPDGTFDLGWTREPNAENIAAEIAKANIPAASWRIITDADVPADRTFRDA